MGIFESALSLLAVILTIVNGWLVFVLKGLQAQLDDLRSGQVNIRNNHDNLRDKQSSHETRMAERTLTREEFKSEMGLQTVQLTQLLNAAVRNINK